MKTEFDKYIAFYVLAEASSILSREVQIDTRGGFI